MDIVTSYLAIGASAVITAMLFAATVRIFR